MSTIQYIRQGQGRISLQGAAKHNSAYLEKRLRSGQTHVTFTMHSDALCTLNGKQVTLAELQAGDFISIRYCQQDIDQDMLACDVIRSTRMAQKDNRYEQVPSDPHL